MSWDTVKLGGITELVQECFKVLSYSKRPTPDELFSLVRFWDHQKRFSDEEIHQAIQALKDAGEFHTVEVLIAGKGE